MIRTTTHAMIAAAVLLAIACVLGLSLLYGPYMRAYYFCRGFGGVESVEVHTDHVDATCEAGQLASWERG